MKNQPQTPISNRGFDAQFLCSIPYHNCLIRNEFITSIDSVRIKYTYAKTVFNFDTKERSDTLDQLLLILSSVGLWINAGYDNEVTSSNFRIGNYQYTVHYKLADDTGFAVLVGRYCYDSSVKQVAPEIILDVNPNKVPEPVWREIADLLAPKAQEISVQRADLAMDFPIPRDQLKLEKRPGSPYQLYSEDSNTEYIGKRSKHSAVKLYDKGADLGADLICTRLEITIDPKKFKTTKALFPNILSLVPLELTMDFASLPFALKALILHPDLYDLLKADTSRNTFAKYKKILDNYNMNAGQGNKTHLTLSDADHMAIDQYFREQLEVYRSAGTLASKMQS